MIRFVHAAGVMVIALGAAACSSQVANDDAAEVVSTSSDELAIVSSDVFYVAVGRCGSAGAGVSVSKVNAVAAPRCLAGVVPSSGVDAATGSAVPGVGTAPGTEVVRVEAGATSPARVRQLFSIVTPPANPLDVPVDGLQFFQATASSCTTASITTFAPVNDAGFLGSKVQRSWGDGDVRVNAAYPLPVGWTDARLRHEVLYEQAAFRGIVERPTFDILHPFAERPLLVTVFDLLPVVRSADRCTTAP